MTDNRSFDVFMMMIVTLESFPKKELQHTPSHMFSIILILIEPVSNSFMARGSEPFFFKLKIDKSHWDINVPS